MEKLQLYLNEAERIRNEARLSPLWKENINALLESNNKLFEGPISYDDMEACFNYVLDQYEPKLLLAGGIATVEQLERDLQQEEGIPNPFFSLIELDPEGKVADVILWETDDREMVGEFLSKKYKWKPGDQST